MGEIKKFKENNVWDGKMPATFEQAKETYDEYIGETDGQFPLVVVEKHLELIKESANRIIEIYEKEGISQDFGYYINLLGFAEGRCSAYLREQDIEIGTPINNNRKGDEYIQELASHMNDIFSKDKKVKQIYASLWVDTLKRLIKIFGEKKPVENPDLFCQFMMDLNYLSAASPL